MVDFGITKNNFYNYETLSIDELDSDHPILETQVNF